jgi:hypothetical protein
MRAERAALLFAASLLAVSCGKDEATPVGVTVVEPTPTPAPTPSPTPVPTAAPTPTPCATCEEPTTNTAPPAKVEITLYWVRIPGGNELAKCGARDEIPVGYTFAIDLTARDENNRPTNGRSDLDWQYDGSDWMVEIASGHRFQPKHTVLSPGDFKVRGLLDGVASDWLHLRFTNDTSSTACAQP